MSFTNDSKGHTLYLGKCLIDFLSKSRARIALYTFSLFDASIGVCPYGQTMKHPKESLSWPL